MKQTKKGFTLVELLVVIAILAILATVSVVGYTSFITKAQISADEQAVVQMNVVLQSVQAGGEEILVDDNQGQTCINIFNNLIENGYSDEFHTYYAKHSIGYVVDHGIIYLVLVEDNAVTFPDKYVGSDYYIFFKPTNNTAEFQEALDSGFALLTEDAIFDEALYLTKDVTIVGNDKLLSDNVTISKDVSSNTIIKVSGCTEDITATLSGLNIVNPDGAYARGVHIGANTGKVTLIIENCTISAKYYALNIGYGYDPDQEVVDIIVRNSTIEGWAAINIWSKANVTFENCNIITHDIATSDDGGNVFAPIVINRTIDDTAYPAGSKLTFKNCSFEIKDRGDDVFIIAKSDCELIFEQCTFKIDGQEVNVNDYKAISSGVTATIITR